MYNPEKTDADRESGGQYLARMWREGLEMPAAMTITQWADEYRYIAGGMSPIAGKWVTDRMPHLAEIMDALSPGHPAQRKACDQTPIPAKKWHCVKPTNS